MLSSRSDSDPGINSTWDRESRGISFTNVIIQYIRQIPPLAPITKHSGSVGMTAVVLYATALRYTKYCKSIYFYLYLTLSDYMEFIWDEEKDEIVRRRAWWQGIGFEDVVWAFEKKQIIFDWPNDSSYEHQSMMILEINWYPYKIPYTQINNDLRKLITIFPYRKFKS